MKTFCDEFLAGPTLADDEQRAIERRGAARTLNRVKEGQALADELFCSLHAPTVGGKSHHLARIFTDISASKNRIPLNFNIFDNVARILYDLKQV